MNFNANASQRQPLGRKIKRVTDVNTMGPPSQPPYNPYNSEPVQFPSNDYTQQPPDYYVPNYPSSPPMYPPNTSGNVPIQQSPQQAQYNFLAQPMVQDMALQYGQQIADTGKKIVKTEIEKYVPVTRLKYYFAVDTRYVLSKLKLLFLPFGHSDWSIKYEQNDPVQPRFEVNAPDLYIPTMAYVTYVLVAGLVLGVQQRFSPEQIGILASSALAWSMVEMAVYSATLYIMNMHTTLGTLDLLAYGGYKYVGIIAAILASLAFGSTGYYTALIYCHVALAFFLMRSLKAQVLLEGGTASHSQYYGTQASRPGSKRRLYFLLFVAIVQPLLSWWLSFHLIGKSTG